MEQVTPLKPRERLLRATADSVREHGFRGASITDIVKRAGVSRRTFYECYPDRESCLLDLFDLVQAGFVAHMRQAVDPALPWRERVASTFDQYVDTVAVEPRLTIAFIHELSALGEHGAGRSLQDLHVIADLLLDLVQSINASDPETRPMSRATALLISGGLRENIAQALAQGQSREQLHELTSAASALIIAAIQPRS